MNKMNNILICSVNWLGDACMTMPALQLFHKQHPDTKITILTKPALKPLWQMHPAVSSIIILDTTTRGMFQTAANIKKHNFDAAYILPNSWRSALIPFMARIPKRIGQTGHHRRLLLTETTPHDNTRYHQQWEYAAIFKLETINELPPPALKIPAEAARKIEAMVPLQPDTNIIGLIPGAARGPSKQWPPEHFIAASKIISDSINCRFVIMGTKNEASLCEEISAAIGKNAISLAGKTTLQELTAAIAGCDCILCNDSGGMHLAGATGTPIVAMYGITDSKKTGPLGKNYKILQPEGVKVSRNIPRDSPEARKALQSIPPTQAAQAALSIISPPRQPTTH